MAYVNLADGTKLWYRTNMRISNGRPVPDASKPTVLIIQGNALTTFTDLEIRHPVLDLAFNLISFDGRSTGKTQYAFDPRRDTWMDTADIAQAILVLELPPLHVFAAGGELVQVQAIKLTVLWADLVKSITFVDAGAKPEDTLDFRVDEDIVNEVTRDLATHEDLDSLEGLCHELSVYVFGKAAPDDIVDVMVENFEVNYSGRNTFRFFDFMMEVLQEPSLDRSLLQLITKPVLYFDSECTTLSRADLAPKPAELRNAPVQIQILKSPPQPHLIEPWATIIHSTFEAFVLSAITNTGAHAASTRHDAPGCMAEAIRRLAKVARRPDVLQHDPMQSASFSLTCGDLVNKRLPLAEEIHRLISAKIVGGILGDDGRPIRKYSERNAEDDRLLDRARTPLHPISGISATVENVHTVEVQNR